MVRAAASLFLLGCLVASLPASAAQSAAAPAAASPRASRASRAGKAAFTGIVNINTATPADLQALPGIGAKTAARIVEYRQKNGPFKKIEDLMNVRGVGEKNFLKLKPQITVAAAAKAEHAENR